MRPAWPGVEHLKFAPVKARETLDLLSETMVRVTSVRFGRESREALGRLKEGH
jgi:hypothetical protein